MPCYDHASNACSDWCLNCQECERTDPLEEAVVKAAVALVGEDIDAQRYLRSWCSLLAAVEALQKERER